MLPLAFDWDHLLFANWPVDSDRLAEHLPQPLAVQEFDGQGWVSAVPFVNVAVRPRWFPRRLGFRLPELNLRTYVTCDGEPGVYFFSLDADGLHAVLGARLTHHLPYYRASIDLRAGGGGTGRQSEDGAGGGERGDGDSIRFESRRRHPGARPARFTARYRPDGDGFVAEPGSRAEFLTERRRLFTQASDGSVRYTRVDHEPWELYPAAATIEENTLFEASGMATPGGEPVCYYSPTIEVVTSRSKRWF